MKRRTIRLLALAMLAAACGDGVTRVTETDIPRQESLLGDTIRITAGDAQTGLANTLLAKAVKFVIKDAAGLPVPMATGTIAVTAGGGTATPVNFKTSSAGAASFKWKLGASGPQTVTITRTTGGATTVVTATVVPVGSHLVIVDHDNQTKLPGDTLLPLHVKLVDPSGVPIPGLTVKWTVEANTGGKVKSATTVLANDGKATNKWVLGWDAHTQHLKAAVQFVDSVTFTATAATAGFTFSAFSGNNQTGLANTALAANSVVLLTNASNVPVAGAKGTFAVTAGGGSLNHATFTTDGNGKANVKLTLGASGAQQFTANIGAVGTVTFNATIPVTVPGYQIVVRYLGTTPTAGQQAAVNAAVARWQQVITGDVADVNMAGTTAECGIPALNEVVEDIVIYVDFGPIDGVGNVLGSAGPCYVRSTGRLPIDGKLKLDAADLADMEADGSMSDVILHEIGHILGFGTIWTDKALLVGAGTTTVHFTGPLAIAAFNAAGGTSFASAKVPVENCVGISGCGAGTVDSHWRESVMVDELMTGYLSGGVRPLSLITIQQFADLGYTVNTASANAFTVGPTFSAGPRPVPRHLRELPPDWVIHTAN